MKRMLFAVMIAAAAACGGRQVEVRTAPQPSAAAATSIQLTNNSSQAVNVYVVSAGTDIFVKQVPARSTETVAVRGVADGATVTLRATTVDGNSTYSKDNVVLTSTYVWQVP